MTSGEGKSAMNALAKSSASGGAGIDSLLREERAFPPPAGFASRARIGQAELAQLHAQAAADPETFWAAQARQLLTWTTPFETVLEWKPPFARWFLGGTLNVSENCLDRHASGPRRHKAALIWEGEPGEQRTFTYLQLRDEVSRFAHVLRKLGVQKGDRVGIYMPMIPEVVIAMQACARLGATHSVVFGGFSAEALRERMVDAGARLIITADGGYRRGKVIHLKDQVDRALADGGAPCVEKVLVVRRTGEHCGMVVGRDHDWNELRATSRPDVDPVPVDSEHPLFILYTSGTTGKPKGVVHSSAGYLLGATLTTSWVFDLCEDDLFWCTADVGWVTGHSYICYGPLANGATMLMYEGAPDTPGKDRFWDLIERHRVSVFYTAPTAIRTFLRWGEEPVAKHDLSSLRLLGTVGEPINPEAWMWYQRVIGGGRCPIVDTYWQTETGSIVVAPLPGATTTFPGSATHAMPGIFAQILDKNAQPVGADQGGFLSITRPWPSMLRTVWGDPDRYAKQYFSQFPGQPGIYFTGDGARQDAHGNFWIMGRVDDVLNVAGHRLGTMEIESAIVSQKGVAEAAVVGRPDDLKGQAVVAFVTLQQGQTPSEAMKHAIRDRVTQEIGPIARPDEIRWADALPKTRSGKIMRRLLKELATSGEARGDVTTLEDVTILSTLAQAGGTEDED
jgi:acetyl-CoA synthetase